MIQYRNILEIIHALHELLFSHAEKNFVFKKKFKHSMLKQISN